MLVPQPVHEVVVTASYRQRMLPQIERENQKKKKTKTSIPCTVCPASLDISATDHFDGYSRTCLLYTSDAADD